MILHINIWRTCLVHSQIFVQIVKGTRYTATATKTLVFRLGEFVCGIRRLSEIMLITQIL
jgi:hypothetical protein